MHPAYESIDEWLRRSEAAGPVTVLTIDLASILGLTKPCLARLARRGEFGPYGRHAGRFFEVRIRGVRAFVEKYRCAFLGWLSTREASRRCGVKPSTLIFWLDAGVINGGRDMHGRVRIDPASLRVTTEGLHGTHLPDTLELQGVTHYSLAHLARALTARSGVQTDQEGYDREFRRNYKLFYRWLTQTPLGRRVRRVGRRRALYIPRSLFDELVDVVRPREAAAIIGESSCMLHYWTRKGRIGYVQFGGTQKMIPREQLEAFMAGRKTVKRQRGGAPPGRQPASDCHHIATA